MIKATIAEWRRRVNAMCCACVDADSLDPLYDFIRWSQSVGYDPTFALPSTDRGRWGAIHKMILESVDLPERWVASSEWLLSRGFTTQNMWDAVGRGHEARSARGKAFGLRTAHEAE